jgi:Fur family zinc uptake transcriptional regulator
MDEKSPLTRNQAMVFDTLARAEAPLSAYTVLDRLRGEGFRAPLQVYRALDKLREMGLVHRLESLNAFVACAHPQGHAHELTAFAICESCGRVEEFSDAIVAERLAAWARRQDFHPGKTAIEIRGICRACAADEI